MKKMTVSWCIVIDADTPLEAAEEALKIQRDSGSTTVFNVEDEQGNKTCVDLEDYETEKELEFITTQKSKEKTEEVLEELFKQSTLVEKDIADQDTDWHYQFKRALADADNQLYEINKEKM